MHIPSNQLHTTHMMSYGLLPLHSIGTYIGPFINYVTILTLLCLCRSLAYFREENISIESFSYATGKNISEVIQDQLGNPEFAFNGVSVSRTVIVV